MTLIAPPPATVEKRVLQVLQRTCKAGHILTRKTIGYHTRRDKLVCLVCLGMKKEPKQRETERQKRDRILERHEQAGPTSPMLQKIKQGEMIREVRKHLLAKVMRTGLPVSANDVHAYCDEHNIPIGPWVGSVFRKGWAMQGVTESTRPGHHRCSLKLWMPK